MGDSLVVSESFLDSETVFHLLWWSQFQFRDRTGVRCHFTCTLNCSGVSVIGNLDLDFS